ncbi:Regulatory protein PchR [Sporomusa ovata DSM 2662]|uniref:Transcriptional regulator, AraC family n=1 Tax=Sporomusa ovata TaxID=2378 RepID=A0A0U1KRV7_9FIRM|nr:AraC family transcriptional regulator [Sporomusa ovata]CQR70160.1 Transcriptional regulator, AraC family [Sporomusa ovata]
MNNKLQISCPDDYYAQMKEIGFISQTSNDLYKFEILKEHGIGEITRCSYRSGLDVSWATLYLKKEFTYAVQMEKKFFFEITYITSGYIEIFDSYTNKSYQINEGEYYVNVAEKCRGQATYPKNIKIGYISFNISEAFLCSQEEKTHLFISEINSLRTFYRACIHPVEANTDIKAIMKKTVNCYYTAGFARRLFFQAIALEIISEWMTHVHFIQSAQKLSTINLSSDDIGLLYQARQELFENMSQPPSIEMLSKNLCLNTHKLKLGFKALFANTPYGYLRDIRLEKARVLLKNTDCSIGNVASQIGYNNSSFVTVFKKKHGITPTQYRKQSKTVLLSPPKL